MKLKIIKLCLHSQGLVLKLPGKLSGHDVFKFPLETENMKPCVYMTAVMIPLWKEKYLLENFEENLSGLKFPELSGREWKLKLDVYVLLQISRAA